MKFEIVFVDDDSVTLFIHETIAEDAGLTCDESKNFTKPLDALAYIQDNDIAEKTILLFLDINMPVMNAWEFLDELKQKHYKSLIHVVLVTSSINMRDKNVAKKYDAVIGFIEKPLEVKELIKIKAHPLLSDFFTDK